MENKHAIRLEFHRQLKRLWEISPALASDIVPGGDFLVSRSNDRPPPAITKEDLSRTYNLYGYNFIPLVTEPLDLLYSIDIIFLRPDRPGDIVWSGDIDNRLKTLLDALRIPEPSERYNERTPSVDDTPMFCLLEDDKLITKVSVQTDRLLQYDKDMDPSEARLIISIEVKPYTLTPWNMHLA